MGRLAKSVLITDLDNTLWDWVAIWHGSFDAMMRVVAERTGIPRERLDAECRLVHQRHGTSEYSLVLEELPSLIALHPGEDIATVYDDAIQAFRAARTEALRPYPTVVETLKEIRRRGARVVAYTESLEYYTGYRLRSTGIDHLLHAIYSPPDHPLPVSREELRKYPPENYQVAAPHRFTPPGEQKPNPDILLKIVASLDVARERVVYVGDSLTKDVAMAQSAGVTDAHARYGFSQDTAAYQLLRRVSHWTDADIEREKQVLKAPTHKPTLVLEKTFGELLELVDFGP